MWNIIRVSKLMFVEETNMIEYVKNLLLGLISKIEKFQ